MASPMDRGQKHAECARIVAFLQEAETRCGRDPHLQRGSSWTELRRPTAGEGHEFSAPSEGPHPGMTCFVQKTRFWCTGRDEGYGTTVSRGQPQTPLTYESRLRVKGPEAHLGKVTLRPRAQCEGTSPYKAQRP